MSAVETREKPGVGEGIGCILLIAIGFDLTWPIWERGRPASFLCLGLFLFSGACSFVAKWIKQPNKKKQDADAPWPDAAKASLGRNIAAGLVSGTQKAALWTGVGMALVWLLQLALNFLPERIDPYQASGLQLAAYDVSHGLKSVLTPLVFLIVILALLALSTWVGSLWPVNLAGQARKWTGIAASILIAFSSMTFVTVQTGSARFDASVGHVRAAIGADLDRLRQARQEKAALQWLGASLEQTSTSPDDAAAWRSYLNAAAEKCASAEAEFAKGFESEPNHPAGILDHYCQPVRYSADLAARQIDAPIAGSAQARQLWSWLPEWAALRGSEQSKLPDIGAAPRRFADLQALAKRVRTAADDEEKARNQVEASVAATMMTMLPGVAPEAVGEVVKSLKQAVVEAIYRDSRDRVALWLRLRNVRVPRPIAAVLGIEPEVRLVSPAAEIARAGGVDALVGATWQRDHPESLAEVRRKGQEQAADFNHFIRGNEVPSRPGEDIPVEKVRPKVRVGR